MNTFFRLSLMVTNSFFFGSSRKLLLSPTLITRLHLQPSAFWQSKEVLNNARTKSNQMRHMINKIMAMCLVLFNNVLGIHWFTWDIKKNNNCFGTFYSGFYYIQFYFIVCSWCQQKLHLIVSLWFLIVLHSIRRWDNEENGWLNKSQVVLWKTPVVVVYLHSPWSWDLEVKREDIKSLRVKGGHLSVIRARTVTIFQKYDQGSY